ncbi:hypothetical protein J4526_01350 [Desulfurococcaceae archaeon MEX13E-LK6-19]|nr:hypothetical protein J4526_01350 [Desulfurococcaceae archaeon MEX13E-LK6-19]
MVKNTRKAKAISEIVSSLLLVIIVISTSTLVVLYVYRNIEAYRSRVQEEIITAETLLKQTINILYVLGNSTTNNVSIVFATGEYPVRIYGILINYTVAENYTVIKGDCWVEDGYLVCNANNMVEIMVRSPIELSPYTRINVIIAYGAGEAEAWGDVI